MANNTSSGGSVREHPLEREAIAAGFRRYVRELWETAEKTAEKGERRMERWAELQERYDGLLIRAREAGLRPGEVAAILKEGDVAEHFSAQRVTADTRRAARRR